MDKIDKLTPDDLDIESLFWKAAATLWPDIQQQVVWEWQASRKIDQRPGDLVAPDLDLEANHPQATIHTLMGHERMVITAVLPADDAYHLWEALEHHDDHDCVGGYEIMDQFVKQLFKPMLDSYFSKFTAPVPPMFDPGEECEEAEE